MKDTDSLSIPTSLLAALSALRAPGPLVTFKDADQLARHRGAYALILDLATNCDVRRAGSVQILQAGWFVYAGSAYGPGGIRARLKRHLSPQKAVRWHVDQLSIKARSRAGLALPGGNECAIAEKLLATARFEAPFPGFGSSDCRACRSHLVRYCQ